MIGHSIAGRGSAATGFNPRLGGLAALGFAILALLLFKTQSDHLLLEGSSGIAALVLGFASINEFLRDDAVENLAPLIAIVGCDGAGKSTLSSDVTGWLGTDHAVALCYLGLGSGEMGERIKRWPLVGPAIEAKLAKKATQTRTAGKKIPGVVTALVVFGFSLARRRRFRRVLALRRRGVIVVTDRYPQTEVMGFYDGPGLSAARAGGWFVAWLASRERRMYDLMVDYRPDLVIRLNIDAATAYRRKPDHKLNSLIAKVAVTPRLRFNGARIVDLDSTLPYQELSTRARRLIREAIDA
ncbi:hypothetical protein KX816_03655 [Sphingosinicellaceae bacterium]|nr:hypothetical protein KX816_03655 [Sphingosinicellaceae bacterium]